MSKNYRCPECQKSGHDNGSDGGHLFLMTGGDRFVCNRVDYHSNKQYFFSDVDIDGSPKFDSEVIEEPPSKSTITLTDVFGSSTPNDTKISLRDKYDDLATKGFRGVPSSNYKKYGVKCECSESPGAQY